MAVTRRDGGVVTLPSCLQVARHQLAFPFVAAAAAMLFKWRNITTDRTEFFHGNYCHVCQYREFIKSQHESLPVVDLPFLNTISIRPSWLDIPSCSLITVLLACIAGAVRRMRLSFPRISIYSLFITHHWHKTLEILTLCRRRTIIKHKRERFQVFTGGSMTGNT